jgi:hypothetical protein
MLKTINRGYFQMQIFPANPALFCLTIQSDDVQPSPLHRLTNTYRLVVLSLDSHNVRQIAGCPSTNGTEALSRYSSTPS